MGLSRGFFPPRIGLVAGDAALLIVPLYNAVRLRTVLLNIHIGEANLALPNSKGIFLIYAIFSVIGWILSAFQLSLHCRSACFHECLGWVARSSVQLWDRSH